MNTDRKINKGGQARGLLGWVVLGQMGRGDALGIG